MSQSIYDFLRQYGKKKNISFHMPGHKGMELYERFGFRDFFLQLPSYDVTEIPGADNLFQAEGIIKETQEIYASLYDVSHSFLLINGSSGGLIAAILASTEPGKKILMARNSHKSIFNALTLAHIRPVYLYPKIEQAYGLVGAIRPEDIEQALKKDPDISAVVLPSPNYYGFCSNIGEISRIVHKYNRILIVDQAHGAHLHFFSKFGIRGLPPSAEAEGADIVINSIHKTLAGFTQSAVMNVHSSRVNLYNLKDKLQMIQSTSPSYILMGILDINARIIGEHGAKLFQEWSDAMNIFYNCISNIKGVRHVKKSPLYDWTKLNFNMEELEIDGGELEKLLNRRYNIYPELYTRNWVMGMTGIGTTKKHIHSLLEALTQISEQPNAFTKKSSSPSASIPSMKPLQTAALPREKELLDVSRCAGRVLSTALIPYPPGIPIACPGEVVTEEIIRYVLHLRSSGEKVIGIDENNRIQVGICPP